MSTYHVFLSYNSNDIAPARMIFEELSKRGIRVWFDQDEIRTGDDVQQRIEDGLEGSQAIVILIGATLGPWQSLEVKDGIREYVSKGRPLFPVLLEGAIADEIPRLLRGHRYLDLRYGPPYEEADISSLAFAIMSRTQIGFSDYVGELHSFERDFLQVLLHSFHLIRTGGGVHLEIAFDHRSPTIVTREARRFVRLNTPDFDNTAAKLEERLQQVYSGTSTAFNHSDEEFAFRYASGGTVPILKIDEIEYYCLFLRSLHPIGWNIANGGCNSTDELCDPTKTILRELQEELIVVDSDSFYTFGSLGQVDLDRPEFAVARDYWNEQFDALGRPRFDQLSRKTIAMPKPQGPDCLTVHFLQDRSLTYDSLFVSVTPKDYGIELDRLLVLPPFTSNGLILCDGEINDARSVNRPVGLFATESFEPSGSLVPDILYHSGKRNDGQDLDTVVSKVLADMSAAAPPFAAHVVTEFREAAERGFGLCPIAEHLLPRVNEYRNQSYA